MSQKKSSADSNSSSEDPPTKRSHTMQLNEIKQECCSDEERDDSVEVSSRPKPGESSTNNHTGNSSTQSAEIDVHSSLPSLHADAFLEEMEDDVVVKSEPMQSSSPGNGDMSSSLHSTDQIISAFWEIKHDLQLLLAGQEALRKSVNHLYSLVKPKTGPSRERKRTKNSPYTTTVHRRLVSLPTGERQLTLQPIPIVTPIYIKGPEAGKFLLGGIEGLVRDVSDYRTSIGKVASRGATKPEAMGRMLCSILLKREFSNQDLAAKNVTGKSRDSQTKKYLEMPKLNEKIMKAIFRQARLQFPDFQDNYTDVKCPTVQLLNDTCKRMRRKVVPSSVVEDGSSVVEDAM